MAKDYYSILGVDKKASRDDIKKAFRKLAHEFHPDKKTGNEEKFKEVNEAYSILGNDKKRAEYDAYGRVFTEGAGRGGPQGWDFSGFSGQGFGGTAAGEGFEFDLGDIFSDFFGGSRRRRGRDVSIDIELPFAESVFGSTRTVLITKTGVCASCGGSRGEPGSSAKTCAACNGNGRVRDARSSIMGTFTTVTTCSACGGSGSVPEKPCKTCNGQGIARRQEEVKLMIPPGIEDGEMIRLSGEGEAVQGGSAGDLYAKVHVTPHRTFKKEGTNLVMDLSVKLTDAILGATYSIRTLEETDIEVKIPAGISTGELLRIKGKGVPTARGKRGDLLIRARVSIPEKLTKKAHALVEELRDEGV